VEEGKKNGKISGTPILPKQWLLRKVGIKNNFLSDNMVYYLKCKGRSK
jgi:hypothetical protein